VTSQVQKIAAELLDTERKYVEKLHLVDQVSLFAFGGLMLLVEILQNFNSL